ncbi:MAG: tRNA guanosine(34) transglycosylase Tgt [Rhodothermales bacterium]|nr:tRNA guanosine(34) transglycosylase Tgt [Rhodothermales bacterium]
MKFTLKKTSKDTLARLGEIETPHGTIDTPIFMPVGTVGTVKGVFPETLVSQIKAQIILGNTYHLYLRPGLDTLRQAGGLHPFMQWDGPILTDSGGYQVYSLAKRRTISEEGVEFQSHIDGSRHLFTPESVIDIQRGIGSDIMMVLDECPPADATFDYAKSSNELTLRWAARCKQRLEVTSSEYGNHQSLFAIVQGVAFHDIRRDSALRLVDMDFPGYAIGGLSVGEPAEVMYEVVERVTPNLPTEKPRYLMGVGTPANLLENIRRGIDMFDCVMPTRNGRNGMLFTTKGILNIRNAKWTQDQSPIDPGLNNSVSSVFSKSYLRHLFISGELLGLQIASIQNLSFYHDLMHKARKAIAEDRYSEFVSETVPIVSRRL